jgi:plastocyanin
MRRTGVWAAAVVVVGLGLALGACGGDDDDAGDRLSGGEQGAEADGDQPAPPEDVVDVDTNPADVRAIDNTFDAGAIRVPAGTTVRWTNEGRQDHDVVPAEGDAWGVPVEDFAPGAVYEHTFDQPGTYSYYCTIHGTATRGMVGAVVVE